jgi:hypothetical protein
MKLVDILIEIVYYVIFLQFDAKITCVQIYLIICLLCSQNVKIMIFGVQNDTKQIVFQRF